MSASDTAVEALGVSKVVRYWLSGGIGVLMYVLIGGRQPGIDAVGATLLALPLGAAAYCISRVVSMALLARLASARALRRLGWSLKWVQTNRPVVRDLSLWRQHEKDLDEVRWWRRLNQPSVQSALEGWADEIHMLFGGGAASIMAGIAVGDLGGFGLGLAAGLAIWGFAFVNMVRFRCREAVLLIEYASGKTSEADTDWAPSPETTFERDSGRSSAARTNSTSDHAAEEPRGESASPQAENRTGRSAELPESS